MLKYYYVQQKIKLNPVESEDQIINEKFGLASINRLNKSRFYPLHLAVLNNHLVCKFLIKIYQPNISSSNSFRIVLKFYLNMARILDALASTFIRKINTINVSLSKRLFEYSSHI